MPFYSFLFLNTFVGEHNYFQKQFNNVRTEEKLAAEIISMKYLGMMGQMVKKYTIKKLETMFPGVYTEKNIVLSTTHTHSGPAGI